MPAWKWKQNIPVIPVGDVGTSQSYQIRRKSKALPLLSSYVEFLSNMHQEHSTPVLAYYCIKWYKDVHQPSLARIHLKDLVYQMGHVSNFLNPFPYSQLSRWRLFCYIVAKSRPIWKGCSCTGCSLNHSRLPIHDCHQNNMWWFWNGTTFLPRTLLGIYTGYNCFSEGYIFLYTLYAVIGV